MWNYCLTGVFIGRHLLTLTLKFNSNNSILRATIKLQEIKIKVLCEQTRELTDDLHDFFYYV